MERHFAVYKGLQKPLVYRGFSGKFIYWGIASLLSGLVLGGLCIALLSMIAGLIALIAGVAGGLCYTLFRQKQGLHQKTCSSGISHLSPKINSKLYVQTQRIPDALYRA